MIALIQVFRLIYIKVILLMTFSIPTVFAATVNITGLRSNKGFVALSVYSEEGKDSFPGDSEGAVQTYYVPVESDDSLTILLKDLPEGNYALSMMHDEDGDGKFKTNLVGIPKEGFGFSNNPTVYFGPPKFEKVLTDIDENTMVKIKVKYFL